MGFSLVVNKDGRIEVCNWVLHNGTFSVDDVDTVTAILRNSAGATITDSDITLSRVGTTKVWAGVFPSFAPLVAGSPVDVIVTAVMSDTDVTTRRKAWLDILPTAA